MAYGRAIGESFARPAWEPNLATGCSAIRTRALCEVPAWRKCFVEEWVLTIAILRPIVQDFHRQATIRCPELGLVHMYTSELRKAV